MKFSVKKQIVCLSMLLQLFLLIIIIINDNWNLKSAFFMPKMIKCALQFDKMIKNK